MNKKIKIFNIIVAVIVFGLILFFIYNRFIHPHRFISLKQACASKTTYVSIHNLHPAKRSRHTFTYCKNFIYLLGGLNQEKKTSHSKKYKVLGDFWRFSIEKMSWQKLADQTPFGKKIGHRAVLVGDNIYFFGGAKFIKEQMVFTNDFYIYNIKTKIWKKLQSKPKGRYHASMVTDGKNKIYLYGGLFEPPETILDDLWEYDIRRNFWKQIARKKISLRPPMIYRNKKLYIQNNIYDLSRHQWNLLPLEKKLSYGLNEAVLIHNQFCLIGGATNERDPGEMTGNIFCYNEKEKKFILFSRTSGTKGFFKGVTQFLSQDHILNRTNKIDYSNYIFSFGGRDIQNNAYNNFDVFCIQENKWIHLED